MLANHKERNRSRLNQASFLFFVGAFLFAGAFFFGGGRESARAASTRKTPSRLASKTTRVSSDRVGLHFTLRGGGSVLGGSKLALADARTRQAPSAVNFSWLTTRTTVRPTRSFGRRRTAPW